MSPENFYFFKSWLWLSNWKRTGQFHFQCEKKKISSKKVVYRLMLINTKRFREQICSISYSTRFSLRLTLFSHFWWRSRGLGHCRTPQTAQRPNKSKTNRACSPRTPTKKNNERKHEKPHRLWLLSKSATLWVISLCIFVFASWMGAGREDEVDQWTR